MGLNLDGTDIATDDEGYLLNPQDWSPELAELRTLLKTLRERHGKDTATRKYVYDLFPYGYGQQACKIAGMHKP